MDAKIEKIYQEDPAPEIGLISAYKQLRPVERVFVDAYLSDLQSSAVAAGQKVKEFLESNSKSVRTKIAHWHAQRMMQRPMVRAAITERMKELTAAMEISAYRVLKEVANVGFASMGDYMTIDEGGQPEFDLTKCTPEQLAAIQSIEIEENLQTGRRKFKFKLHDKLNALDKIMRYMGMFEADNMQTSGIIEDKKPPMITKETSTAVAADLYARTLRREV
jgi:phage terminase small subunit